MNEMTNAHERQIVLDTETTGLETSHGHRIIEIGCVELINRKFSGNNYRVYLNPDREIEQGAIEVHGISNEFLQDKPHFEDIADQFLSYIEGAELVIHNAPFDVGFLNAELARLPNPGPSIEQICQIHDTLVHARKLFPGQRNDLDSLCNRYEVNNSHRDLHGALLDAEILADVYLLMTGGQGDLSLVAAEFTNSDGTNLAQQIDLATMTLPEVVVSAEELEQHQQWVARLNQEVEGLSVFAKLEQDLH